MSEEGEAQKRQTALNAGDNKQIAKDGQALPTDDLASESLLQREYLKSIFITLDSDLNGTFFAAHLGPPSPDTSSTILSAQPSQSYVPSAVLCAFSGLMCLHSLMCLYSLMCLQRSCVPSSAVSCSGFIDASELKAFDSLTEQQQKEIFAKMDKQKYRDGRVGLDEFLLFWTSAIEQTSWGNS